MKFATVSCKHRDYKAKRRPRVNCETCWRIYIEKHPITEVQRLSEDLREALSRQPLIPVEEWW